MAYPINRTPVMKEFHDLFRRFHKLYDGQIQFLHEDGIEEIEDEFGENLLTVPFLVTPKEGPYKDATIEFVMHINDNDYPEEPPIVYCKNRLYHPNIDYNEGFGPGALICVSLLDADWQPEVGLDGSLMAVLFLLLQPQIDDNLSMVCKGFELEDWDKYVRYVRHSLRGGTISGTEFDKLIANDEDCGSDSVVGKDIVELEKIVDDIKNVFQEFNIADTDGDGNNDSAHNSAVQSNLQNNLINPKPLTENIDYAENTHFIEQATENEKSSFIDPKVTTTNENVKSEDITFSLQLTESEH